VTGLIEDTSIEDYAIYLSVSNVPVVSVNADSEFEDFASLFEAMQTDNITVGTAGVNSSGGMALASLGEASEGALAVRMVTYDGGAPAVLAAASGEVEVTTQLAVEQTEMIRAERLRPLAVLSDTALEIEGIDPIPPITDTFPDFEVAADYFGILIPAGAPDEVYETVQRIWEEDVANSEVLRAYATDRGAVFAPSAGDEALEKVLPVIRAEACARVSRGEAVVDPSEIGIDCPEG